MTSFETNKKKDPSYFQTQGLEEKKSSSEKNSSSGKKFDEVFPDHWSQVPVQNSGMSFSHQVDPDLVIHEVSQWREQS